MQSGLVCLNGFFVVAEMRKTSPTILPEDRVQRDEGKLYS